jgi:D-alanine-D-alanine ligase
MTYPFEVVIVHRVLHYIDPLNNQPDNSLQTVVGMPKALQKAGIKASLLLVESDIEERLKAYDPATTIFFNTCEGEDDNPNWYDPITSLLERLGLNCTGARDEILQGSQDKRIMKEQLLRGGVSTPDYEICADGKLNGWGRFPALVKPANQHGSFGITRTSVVDSYADLKRQVEEVLDTWKGPALIEDFIDGAEYRAYMVGNGDHIEIMPLYATIYDAVPDHHDRLFGFDNKWKAEACEVNELLHYELPAKLSPEMQTLIEREAKAAYRAVEARDWGACDIRVRDGVPYVLDANQNADISEGYSFATAAAAGGITYPELLKKVVLHAAERLPVPV